MEYLTWLTKEYDISLKYAKRIHAINNATINMHVSNQQYHLLIFRSRIDGNIDEDLHATSIYGIIYLDAKYKPAYVSYSPSLVSMDGEYRRRIIPWKQFEELYNDSIEILSYVEDHVQEQLNSNKLQLSFSVLSEGYPNTLDAYIEDSRIPFMVFVISWLVNGVYFTNGLLENHINDRFINNIISNKTNATLLIKDLNARFTGDFNIPKVIHYFTKVMWGYVHPSNLECGQKFTPITVAEKREYGSIKHGVWREHYCNRLLGDLVINQVTPSLPIFIEAFLVPMNLTLFDNTSMIDKIYQSNKTRQAMEQLKNVQKDLTIHDTLVRVLDSPIQLAEKNIIYTDNALCTISEYVGRTIADMPYIMTKSISKDAIPNMFTSLDMFSKVMFEIIYALLACNSVGVMHGDLHLNNCTIKIGRTEVQQDTYHIYSVYNKHYVFQETNTYSCLIDFSRAILEPSNPILNDEGPELLREDVLYIYKNYLPKFYSMHKADLEVMLIKEPRIMYRIFTAFDVYHVTSKLFTLYKDRKLMNDIKVDKGVIEFTESLNKASKNILTNDVKKLFDRIVDLDSIQFPNYTLLSLFDHYAKEMPHKDKITDHYAFTGTLKYSLTPYDSRPPYIQQVGKITNGKVEIVVPPKKYRKFVERTPPKYNIHTEPKPQVSIPKQRLLYSSD